MVNVALNNSGKCNEPAALLQTACRARSRMRGEGDLAQLRCRQVLESWYIHHEEAPSMDALSGVVWDGGDPCSKPVVLNLGVVTPQGVIWDFSGGNGGF